MGFNSPASPNLEGGAVIGPKGFAPRFPSSIGLHLKIDACKSFSIKPRGLDRSQGFHASGNAKRVAIIGIGFKPLMRGKATDDSGFAGGSPDTSIAGKGATLTQPTK